MLTILGIPLDQNSSYLRGPARAPSHIREALHSGSGNWCVENGLDIRTSDQWHDAGDLQLDPMPQAFTQITEGVAALLAQGHKVLSLGGDHSITYPIIRAFAGRYPKLTILHIDAHPDLYDELDGNRFSHACPFARIMEEGLASRLVQVGIRTLSGPQRAQVDRFGVEIIDMRSWRRSQLITG